MPEGDQRIVRRNAHALGVIAVAFGATIVACHVESGASRWSAAAWAFALEVPGSPATWGVIILAAGAVLLYGHYRDQYRTRLYSAHLAFWWFCSLAAAAMIALGDDIMDNADQVNPLSLITWALLAWMYRLQIHDEQQLRADCA